MLIHARHVYARTLAALCVMYSGSLVAAELAPCPASPNCVSSQADPDDSHFIAPLAGKGSQDASRESLEAILAALPRISMERVTENHIRAVFTSRIFRFKDDVDLIIDEQGRIDVRSASRIGYADLGANRKRVEMLREKLADNPAE